MISGLLHLGAEVDYLDPHVPELDEGDVVLKSVPASVSFGEYDAVVIVTDYRDIDYTRLLAEAESSWTRATLCATSRATRARSCGCDRVRILFHSESFPHFQRVAGMFSSLQGIANSDLHPNPERRSGAAR